ncbi:unnamed protein product, partial [Polarella glacialis]
ALPKDLMLHYSVIRDWKEPIDATGNVVIISIPSVVNPSLAPEGRHCLHAYLAATEPYELWANLKRGSPEYEALKRERARPLFEAVERALPGATSGIELELIGTPLTHARFNRRLETRDALVQLRGQGAEAPQSRCVLFVSRIQAASWYHSPFTQSVSALSMGQHIDKVRFDLAAWLPHSAAEELVLDVRGNPGGSFSVLPLVESLALFVFSSCL